MKQSLNLWLLAITTAVLTLAATIPTDAYASGLKYKTFLEREIECLAKNIYYEAGSEPIEGKIAVAQVTVNRSEDERYPDTICNVVHQKTSLANRFICQFSWVCRKPRGPIDPENYQESLDVAERVLLGGERIAKLKNALYFHASRVSPNWKKIRVAKIGNHIFYKDKSS